jgi:hypothetical protein
MFAGHELVNFREFGAYTWVDLKHFTIGPDDPDTSLLSVLISDDHYRDHYAAPHETQGPPHGLHGPYKLEAITPAVFRAVPTAKVQQELRCWVSSWVDADRLPAAMEILDARVLGHVQGSSIFRLPDMRATASHEWGWVVGQTGFHEFVAIDRYGGTLTLIVASDD